MHVLILGITTSGKSTLAARMAQSYRNQGYPVMVLDPLLDSRWEGSDLVTANPVRFLKSVKKSYGCMLFCDESAETVGRYHEEMFYLATRARHDGHISHFITQRYTQLNKTVRDQCSHLFVFRVGNVDAKNLVDDWANEELIMASQLQKFEFVYVNRFGGCKRYMITRNGIAEMNHGFSRNSGSSAIRISQ